MEILVGPTFTIDVSSSPSQPTSYGIDQHPTRDPAGDDHAVPSCLFTRPEKDGSGYRITGRQADVFEAESSDNSSSSIGTPDDSDNDLSSFKRDGDVEDEDEVQSKFNGGLGLKSLDSLEDSLPIKRGLSNHFEGKSKSFTDLSQISCVKDLKKQENPFNKRRRVLIASKLSRKSAFYSWSNPKSMPLLPVDEDEDEDYELEKARKVPSPSSSSSSSLTEEKKQDDQIHSMRQTRVPESYAAKMRLRLGSFKARSFSLADLQEHDDEDDDEED